MPLYISMFLLQLLSHTVLYFMHFIEYLLSPFCNGHPRIISVMLCTSIYLSVCMSVYKPKGLFIYNHCNLQNSIIQWRNCMCSMELWSGAVIIMNIIISLCDFKTLVYGMYFDSSHMLLCGRATYQYYYYYYLLILYVIYDHCLMQFVALIII